MKPKSHKAKLTKLDPAINPLTVVCLAKIKLPCRSVPTAAIINISITTDDFVKKFTSTVNVTK